MRGFGAQCRGLGGVDGALRGLDRACERDDVRRAVLGLLAAPRVRSRRRRSGLRAASGGPSGRAIARSSWLRRAVRSASAPVSSAKIFSTSASAAPGFADTRRHRRLAFGDAACSPASGAASSAASRSSAAAASAASRCSRAMSCASCTSRRSSSAMRSLARASSRSSASRAITRRCSAAPARGLLVAQRRQRGGSHAPVRSRSRPALASRSATRRIEMSFALVRLGDFGVGGEPAQMEQRRLGLAHLGRHLPVAAPPGAPGA